MKAARFDWRTRSFFLNRSSIHSSVASIGREYMKLTRPSAKKFFERSASRGFTPRGTVASLVSEVIGTCTTL